MLKKFISQNTFLYALIIVLGFTASCKKSSNNPDSNTDGESNLLQTPTNDRALLSKDSIFLYAKQTYFWNAGMPNYDTFNPRKYSSENAIIAALKALPGTGGKDKYSFIDDGSVASQLSGAGEDYGFSANFDANDLLRVKYVYPGSPADLKGLKRGYQLIKVNGGGTSRSSTDIANLNASIFGDNPSISLTFIKPGGGTQDIIINRASYNINPVLFTNTYTIGAKKVGYIVFNSFTTNATAALDAAFSKFTADGVTELVVDLRYNGGGSVATSELFINLIAPPAQNGKIMYTTYWTKTMQDGNATILQNQKFYAQGNDGVTRLYSYFDYSYKPTIAAGNQENFVKRGALNGLTRVYFLVTGGTASASELLINNLKPVVDVKLIGKTTYGKPVGFFSIRIDKNDLYIPQFQTKNQLDQGDYFAGMTVDKDVADDLTKDFGDPSEKMLAQALYYSANNNFSALAKDNVISSTSGIGRQQIDAANKKLGHEFKGMVETRKLKFK
ncbi:Peptidase family S41 [Pedobacter terrae]|uniref:Peptidase family S41 n=1 Tax=Pedobacter terrae TaxID=405671 RepID=A0A1G7V236_9SPHI|nr:S41 family peptidase [Pedobacter terrae]SDG53638.1 Peptidase family S41 [Pedobacter terrae]